MSDPVARLNAALEGRYAIERELGEGGNWAVAGGDSGDRLFRRQSPLSGLMSLTEISRTWVAKMAELGMTYRYIEIPGGDHISIIASDRDNVQAIFDFFDLARRN